MATTDVENASFGKIGTLQKWLYEAVIGKIFARFWESSIEVKKQKDLSEKQNVLVVVSIDEVWFSTYPSILNNGTAWTTTMTQDVIHQRTLK